MADRETPDPVSASFSAKTRPTGKRPDTPRSGGSGLLRLYFGKWGVTVPIAAVLGGGGIAAIKMWPHDETIPKLEAQIGALASKVETLSEDLDDAKLRRQTAEAEAKAERTILQLRLADLQKQCSR